MRHFHSKSALAAQIMAALCAGAGFCDAADNLVTKGRVSLAPPAASLLRGARLSEDWKKELLTYCLHMKEDIELKCDEEMMRSSIAVSHFDRAMEVTASAETMSEEVTGAIEAAAASREAFEAGQTPDFVVGLNKLRLKRFAGANVNEFVLLMPPDYSRQHKWPLYVEIDPRRRLPYGQEKYVGTAGMVNLWWHWPKNEEGNWKDFERFLQLLKAKLNIDEDRIYMAGDCANGIAAMDAAFHHPDIWAECVVSVGNSFRHLAGNAYNVPFTFLYSDVHEGIRAYYDFAAECFEYCGCRQFRRWEVADIHAAHAGFVPSAVRRTRPKRVKLAVDSLGAAHAYWVGIDAREDENFPARIDAQVEGQAVRVQTSNVTAYRLDLWKAPVDMNSAVEIIENGKPAGFASGPTFRKQCRERTTGFVKNSSIHGPVSDVFTDGYAVIWGSGGKTKQAEEQVARALARGAPVYADLDAPPQISESLNLVLVGTPESNRWLAKIVEQSPVLIAAGCVTADGQKYTGADCGAIFIMPNPLNPEKYVAVFSALSNEAMAALPKAYSEMRARPAADAAVFEVTENGRIIWHICEKLDAAWGWHKTWSQVIANTSKHYPKIKWLQAFSHAMRTELGADAAVCEDPFADVRDMPTGPMTFRDLNNLMTNEWVVKVKLRGKTLKKLLTAAFTGYENRQVKPVVVDGVDFSSSAAGNDAIPMNDITDDGYYTVVLPENIINGHRVGVAIEDYEIVADGHLILLVRDFFLRNKESGIDTLLESVEPRVF